MLNTNTSKVDIKTPASGIMQKSSDKSFFLKFHQNSNLADSLFEDAPTYKKQPISVLQIMLINDSCMLAECVYE